MQTKNILELLRIAVRYDCSDRICWNENLEFFIPCHNVFYWNTPDAEPVEDDDLDLLEASLKDGGVGDGPVLYCCRKRQMRPLDRYYSHIDAANHELFEEIECDFYEL